MTECIPDFHVSTISLVSIDRFSPNFCHWCILGHRWPDYVFGSKGQSSTSHHRGGGAQHSTLPSSATFFTHCIYLFIDDSCYYHSHAPRLYRDVTHLLPITFNHYLHACRKNIPLSLSMHRHSQQHSSQGHKHLQSVHHLVYCWRHLTTWLAQLRCQWTDDVEPGTSFTVHIWSDTFKNKLKTCLVKH